MLIAVRVVVVTSLLLTALIIQFGADIVLPIDYIYMITGLTYALTLIYIGLGRLIPSRNLNIYIQSLGDLVVETLLVYFTGGLDSPFSFLYLVSVITASILLYRRGGLIIASGAVIFYGALADLMYYQVIPPAPRTLLSPAPWTSLRLYLNLATNFAGFYATALLTSYVSEKLRQTFKELDVNRQNLAELRALNENVIESIPSGVLTLSSEGAVAFANPAAREILRHSSEQLVGFHLTDLGIFEPEEWQRLRSLVQNERIARGEQWFRGKDSEELRSIGYALTPLNTLEGEPFGLTLIFQDLTDMKRLERQLRMKDRMAAVGELSAGIAHEIRNPLAAISGSVQVLRKSQNLQPHEQRLMSIILKESDRLNQSIADFLRFVKPQERSPASFDVAGSLGETLELLVNSPEVGEDHRIEQEIEPSSFSIIGDPNQIRQVFWNVAKNALQAMAGGGTLRVTAGPDEGNYTILFADEGRGMNEADQRRLFQPFRTNVPSGTGLGMAISYRIIQEHQGSIAVDSIPGRGTMVAVSLPIAGTVEEPSPDLPVR